MTKEGDTIELIHTSDPYSSLSAGDRGTVTRVKRLEPPIVERPTRQVWVDWENGSNLALLEGEDSWKVV